MRPGGSGDVTATHLLWHYSSGGTDVPTGVIYADRLYVVSGRGVVACRMLDSGKAVWRDRLDGDFVASLIAGDGSIYATSEQGNIYVFEAADQFRLVSTNQMNERCLATPAVARDDIFVRTEHHLYRIGTTSEQSDEAIALAEPASPASEP